MESVVSEAKVEFRCPRCHNDVVENFYGPCSRCVGELRANQQLDQREVQDIEFVPKLNVVPNSVATKE